MIRTLRIAGVLIAAVALVLFALPVVFGSANGKDNQKLLDSETIIEKFKKSQDSLAQKNNQAQPPLVLQAQAFARYLIPPIVEGKTENSLDSRIEIPKPQPIVQFKLLSTCVHQTSPERSFALVDQPGDGLLWVRPSDKISHFLVKEVKSGLLIVNDGQKNIEVKLDTQAFESIASPTPSSLPSLAGILPGRGLSAAAPSSAARSSARNPGATSVPPMPSSGVRTTPGFSGPMTMPTMPSTRSSAGSTQSTTRPMSAEEEAAALKLMSELDSALAGINESATEEDMKKADELIEKHFNKLDNMQISDQEAEKINDLGQKLDKAQQEPNKPRPSTVKTRPQTSPGD